MKAQKQAETDTLPRSPHQNVQVNKAPRLRYVTDEFGNVGLDNSLWSELDPAEAQPIPPTDYSVAQRENKSSGRVQPTSPSKASNQNKPKYLKRTPASSPGGYLNLTKLPPIKKVEPRASIAPEKKQPKKVSRQSPQKSPGGLQACMVQCPHCKSKVKQARIEGHIAKVHGDKVASKSEVKQEPAQTPRQNLSDLAYHGETMLEPTSGQAQELAICPVCNVSVKHSRLMRHLRKVHGQALQAEVAKIPKQAVRTPKASKGSKRQPVYEIDTRKSPPALQQYAYEARFGDKYVGYMQREQGRWGVMDP